MSSQPSQQANQHRAIRAAIDRVLRCHRALRHQRIQVVLAEGPAATVHARVGMGARGTTIFLRGVVSDTATRRLAGTAARLCAMNLGTPGRVTVENRLRVREDDRASTAAMPYGGPAMGPAMGHAMAMVA